MDKYHSFELGLAMGKGMLLNNQADRESLATDSKTRITVKEGKIMRFDNNLAYDRWITIHPHGDDNRHIEIDDKTGEILKGLSPNLQGTHIYDLKENLKRLKDGKKPYTVSDYPNGKNQPKQVEQPESKVVKFNDYRDNPVYKDNKDILTKLINKDLSDTIQNYLKENEFKTLREFGEFLKEHNRAACKALVKLKEQEFFKNASPSVKFFGKNGTEKVTGQYFKINHNPNELTVILDDVADRLRVTGKGDLIFLTDKNKGYYLNESNSLPVLSYNKDDNTHNLHMIVKFNDNDLRLSMKEYTFKNDFVGTENLKPLNGFKDLKELAAEKDKNEKSYKNVSSNEIFAERIRFADNLKKAESAFRKSAETVQTGGKGSDIDKYLDKWNGKVYKYKDGTKAIFSNNQKIILTDEQFEYLQSKSK